MCTQAVAIFTWVFMCLLKIVNKPQQMLTTDVHAFKYAWKRTYWQGLILPLRQPEKKYTWVSYYRSFPEKLTAAAAD